MSKPGSRGMWIRRTIIGIVLAAAVVGAVVGVQQLRPEDETVTPVPVLEEVTAERTDLSGSVTLDGTVENSSTLQVLHRIEGATPSTASSATTQTQPETATPSNAQGVAFVQLEPATVSDAAYVAATDESTTTVADTTSTEPVTEPPDSTTTTVTPETTTTPDTTPTTTPDTTPTAPPDTTTVPDTATPTDPTAEPGTEQPTTSSTPDGAAPSGGAPSGGAPSGGMAPGGTGTGSAGAGATTENVTERITSLPALGATIELGDPLYSVDGTPVIAMAGTLPAWRGLSSSSDDGADIAQLETSLLALGYDADGDLVVDNEWDSATTKAVKAWQTGLGVEATGEIELGDIVFLPSTVTVTALDTAVGADVTEQDRILDVSGTSQQVVADVDEDAEGTVVPGLTVQLSTETPTEGVVTLMRSVTAEDGTITVEAVVTPTSSMTGQADGSSLDIEVDVDGPSDAITVPADALVSKLDGSYQVEVRDESGDHWVVVEIIQVRGSKVAVSGIDEGATVLVPA